MSAISGAWKVTKSGVDYTTESDNQHIIYRVNDASEATLVFDNSDKSLMSVFSEEDEVTLKIGSQKMMTGFIEGLEDVLNPSGKLDLVLTLKDWGHYYGAKKSFEKTYMKTVTASQVLSDAAARVPGMTTNITALNTLSESMKKDFSGTYSKDGWEEAAINGGADYFVDENKVLQAWPFGTRNLVEPGSGIRYVIQDVAPFVAYQLKARFDKPIKFKRDVSGKYRSVIQTNGIDELYPSDIDLAVTSQLWNPNTNMMYSAFFDALGAIGGFAAGKIPFKFLTSSNVAGAQFPTIQLMYPHSGGSVSFQIGGRTYISGGQINQPMGMQLGTWQSLRFIMKNALTGATVTGIELRLIDSAGGYWTRNIYPDLIDQSGARNNFTFLQYDLPIDDSVPVSNFWSKVGSPHKMDFALMIFSPISGYAEDSYLEFSKLYWYRKQRKTAPSSPSGTPATEKISVNATVTNPSTLQVLANQEYRRVSTTAKQPDIVIDGNVNFRMPGYAIDVDLSHIFDGTRTGSAVRLQEIHHDLMKGVHYTELFLDNSYNRR